MSLSATLLSLLPPSSTFPTSYFLFPQSIVTTSSNTINSTFGQTVPSSGCGNLLPPQLIPGGPSTIINITSPNSSPNATLQHREYRIHLPTNYPPHNDSPRPLLLMFHGQGQTSANIENYTKWSEDNVNPNGIVVYPQGITNQFLGDPAAPSSSLIDDRVFVRDVLDDVEGRFCIDTSRVYGAGFSNGGGMTGLLACDGSGVGARFAALAAVAGAYYADTSLAEPLFGADCAGSGVPYLAVAGTNDKIIAYDGDNSPLPDTFPVLEFVNKMVRLNHCSSGVELVPGLGGVEGNTTQVLNGGEVTRYAWTCEGREDVVVHYRVEGLGHGWPSTVWFGGILDEYRGGTRSWNVSSVIGEWFGRWTVRG